MQLVLPDPGQNSRAPTGTKAGPATCGPLRSHFRSYLCRFLDCHRSGDVLVLLSDGLIEATGTDDEEFGLGRIKEILSESSTHSAQEMVDQLMLTNQRFVAGNLDQVDDRTVLVIKVE